jgi:Alpha galactosidase C-terminal beta sandwich domain
VVLLNRGTANGEISVSWEDLGYPVYLSARVRDLWQAKDLGEHKGMFSAPVALHSVVMVTVKPYALLQFVDIGKKVWLPSTSHMLKKIVH